jgi:nitroreductase
MQNFEIIAVDDPALIGAIGDITSTVTLEFLRENYEQVSFSDEELARRRVGISARGFPPSWLDPARWEDLPANAEFTRKLHESLLGCPVLLVVLYNTERRAPASEGDSLGLIGLGCVLENMWMSAQSLGISVQVLASLAGGDVEPALAKLLGIPDHMRVAFGCRLGHPLIDTVSESRVRREIGDFAYRNVYGNPTS